MDSQSTVKYNRYARKKCCMTFIWHAAVQVKAVVLESTGMNIFILFLSSLQSREEPPLKKQSKVVKLRAAVRGSQTFRQSLSVYLEL